MLLLDTNALVWWLTDHTRLGRRAGRRIDSAWPLNVSISTASWYELSLVHAKGHARLDESPAAMRLRLVGSGLIEFDVEGSIALDAAYLDGISRDPIDRLIVATARKHNATLITSDQSILAWRGDLDRLDARK